jgi:hypothetical protein
VQSDVGKKKQSDVSKGKEEKKQSDVKKGKEDKKPEDWLKKSSIFFKLPYWKCNKLRHNLDILHMEKNVCDNFIATLLDICKKTKDGTNA